MLSRRALMTKAAVVLVAATAPMPSFVDTGRGKAEDGPDVNAGESSSAPLPDPQGPVC